MLRLKNISNTFAACMFHIIISNLFVIILVYLEQLKRHLLLVSVNSFMVSG
jgi:hypothetical protein